MKKKKPVKPSRPFIKKPRRDITKLEKELDTVFSKFIRLRDFNICFTRGMRESGKPCSSIIQNGHLFVRGKSALRFNEMNCHAQCSHCNMTHVHQTQYYTMAFIRKYGTEAYERLYELSRMTMRKQLIPYEDLIKNYSEKVKTIANQANHEAYGTVTQDHPTSTPYGSYGSL